MQPVCVAAELEGITDKNVARYIAKYATKGAEAPGTVEAAEAKQGDDEVVAGNEDPR